MELVRSVALSRHTAPSFVMLSGLELLQLRKLPDRSFRLFVELLAMADHATGRISTTYARLLGLLDFDQAPGAHTADKPTLRKLRTALEALVGLQLVRIDRIKNEKAKGLFLQLMPRSGISAPVEKTDRRSDRPARKKKPDAATTCEQTTAPERQTEGQGVQEEFIPPNPHVSTTEALQASPAPAPQQQRDTYAQRQIKAAIAATKRHAGGDQQAPQGGQNVAAAPHAPPGRIGLGRSVRNSHQQTDEGPTARTGTAGHQAGCTPANTADQKQGTQPKQPTGNTATRRQGQETGPQALSAVLGIPAHQPG